MTVCRFIDAHVSPVTVDIVGGFVDERCVYLHAFTHILYLKPLQKTPSWRVELRHLEALHTSNVLNSCKSQVGIISFVVCFASA